MPRSLDQANTQKLAEASQGDKISGQDLEIAVRMGIKLLNDGGIDVIRDAINKSQDPAMVIGQFLTQVIGILAEQLVKELDADPRLFLAKDGWLEEMLDYIEKKLGYPEEFSDQIYMTVLETIKAASMGPDAPNNVMEGAYENGEQGELPPEAPMPSQPRVNTMPRAGGYR